MLRSQLCMELLEALAFSYCATASAIGPSRCYTRTNCLVIFPPRPLSHHHIPHSSALSVQLSPVSVSVNAAAPAEDDEDEVRCNCIE